MKPKDMTCEGVINWICIQPNDNKDEVFETNKSLFKIIEGINKKLLANEYLLKGYLESERKRS